MRAWAHSLKPSAASTAACLKSLPATCAARVELLRAIGRAVAALHDGGVVHGDLTTSNLLVREADRALVGQATPRKQRKRAAPPAGPAVPCRRRGSVVSTYLWLSHLPSRGAARGAAS